LQQRGLLTVVPHPNTILRVMRKTDTTQILRRLIDESAKPLRLIETDFAPDATGIGRKGYVRWYDKKWGRDRREKMWLKLHLMVGVKTMIATGAEVTKGNEHDSPHLPALIDATAKNFTMNKVLADKGYLARDNFRAIVKAGAEPFIPFKPNSKPSRHDALWTRLLAAYTFNREAFLAEYHMRSLSEAAFSSMKRVLSSSVDATSFQGGVTRCTPKCSATTSACSCTRSTNSGSSRSSTRRRCPPTTEASSERLDHQGADEREDGAPVPPHAAWRGDLRQGDEG